MNRIELNRMALRAAIAVRRKASVTLDVPICVYDFVPKLHLDVRFVKGASFSGLYAKGYDVLFVPTERPAGRRAFTCAHELAHWWFKHGTQIEHLDFEVEDNELPEEVLANHFAAFLLMPRSAIEHAFRRRQINPQDADPLLVYTVASEFGVGYETIVKHLRWSLRLIDDAQMKMLLRTSPKLIRNQVVGDKTEGHLIIVDENWQNIPIDLEQGDHAVIPHGSKVIGKAIEHMGSCLWGDLVKSVRPGLAQATGRGDWAQMIRVSRKQYEGRGEFRHLEEDDD